MEIALQCWFPSLGTFYNIQVIHDARATLTPKEIVSEPIDFCRAAGLVLLGIGD